MKNNIKYLIILIVLVAGFAAGYNLNNLIYPIDESEVKLFNNNQNNTIKVIFYRNREYLVYSEGGIVLVPEPIKY